METRNDMIEDNNTTSTSSREDREVDDAPPVYVSKAVRERQQQPTKSPRMSLRLAAPNEWPEDYKTKQAIEIDGLRFERCVKSDNKCLSLEAPKEWRDHEDFKKYKTERYVTIDGVEFERKADVSTTNVTVSGGAGAENDDEDVKERATNASGGAIDLSEGDDDDDEEEEEEDKSFEVVKVPETFGLLDLESCKKALDQNLISPYDYERVKAKYLRGKLDLLDMQSQMQTSVINMKQQLVYERVEQEKLKQSLTTGYITQKDYDSVKNKFVEGKATMQAKRLKQEEQFQTLGLTLTFGSKYLSGAELHSLKQNYFRNLYLKLFWNPEKAKAKANQNQNQNQNENDNQSHHHKKVAEEILKAAKIKDLKRKRVEGDDNPTASGSTTESGSSDSSGSSRSAGSKSSKDTELVVVESSETTELVPKNNSDERDIVAGNPMSVPSFAHGEGGSGGRSSKDTKGRRWTEEEHMSFLRGMRETVPRVPGHKGDWISISQKYVPTRTPQQIASHAQKYFNQLALMENIRKKDVEIVEVDLETEKDNQRTKEETILDLEEARMQCKAQTLKGMIFKLLEDQGTKGLTISTIARLMEETGMRSWKDTMYPNVVIGATCVKYPKIFTRVAPYTFALTAYVGYKTITVPVNDEDDSPNVTPVMEGTGERVRDAGDRDRDCDEQSTSTTDSEEGDKLKTFNDEADYPYGYSNGNNKALSIDLKERLMGHVNGNQQQEKVFMDTISVSTRDNSGGDADGDGDNEGESDAQRGQKEGKVAAKELGKENMSLTHSSLSASGLEENENNVRDGTTASKLPRQFSINDMISTGLDALEKDKFKCKPNTIKGMIFRLLEEAGPEGLHITHITEIMQERGMKDWNIVSFPEQNVTSCCCRDPSIFVRVAPNTFALRSLIAGREGQSPTDPGANNLEKNYTSVRKRWTTEEDAVIIFQISERGKAANVSSESLAKHFGRPRESVAARGAIMSKTLSRFSKEEHEQLVNIGERKFKLLDKYSSSL